MTTPPNLIDEALQGWTYAREGVIAELENIPHNEFGFQPTPHSRTLAQLAQHIVESSLVAAGELARPDGNFQRQDYPEFIAEYAGTRARATGKDALITLLKTVHEEVTVRLRHAGDLLMQPIVQFNGEPATRLTWLQHAIAHEEYHRGQIALYARLLGHTPALTRLIEER